MHGSPSKQKGSFRDDVSALNAEIRRRNTERLGESDGGGSDEDDSGCSSDEDENEEGERSRLPWALRRLMYSLDAASASARWQTVVRARAMMRRVRCGAARLTPPCGLARRC
jgi:hypothetical protein